MKNNTKCFYTGKQSPQNNNGITRSSLVGCHPMQIHMTDKQAMSPHLRRKWVRDIDLAVLPMNSDRLKSQRLGHINRSRSRMGAVVWSHPLIRQHHGNSSWKLFKVPKSSKNLPPPSPCTQQPFPSPPIAAFPCFLLLLSLAALGASVALELLPPYSKQAAWGDRLSWWQWQEQVDSSSLPYLPSHSPPA